MVKISLLNTIYKNQESNSLIACLTNSMLSEKNISSKPLISLSHFRSIIKEIEKLSIKTYIDPVENLFYDTVSLDRQYYSYENININPTYTLNHMINVLKLYSSRKENTEFTMLAMSMVRFILGLQTNIIMTSKETNPSKRNYKREIYFYDSIYYSNLKKYITVDYNHANEITHGEINHLVIQANEADSELFGCIDNGVFSFFSKPFFKYNESLIILDPTILTTSCTNYILLLAKRYNIIGDLINNYKKSIINDTELCIKMIDNAHKIYSLESNNKQVEYLVEEYSDKRIMLHTFIIDDEESYDEKSLLKQSIGYDIVLDDIITPVIVALKNKYLEVYLNISIITFGRGFFLGTDMKLPCISLSPYQLCVISKNKRVCNNILYYFAKEKYGDGDINNSFFNSFHGDFSYFIIYDEHECSFYINDEIPLRECTIFADFDIIYEYVYRSFSLKSNNVISYNHRYSKIKHIENNKYFGMINNNPAFIIKGKSDNFISIQFSGDIKSKEFTFAEYFGYWLSEIVDYIDFQGINKFIYLDYDPTRKRFTVNNKNDGYYEIIFGDDLINYLSENNYDNSHEREVFVEIINSLEVKVLDKDINRAFGDKLKKRIYTIEYKMMNYMVPVENVEYPIPISSQSKMSNLLDDIGEKYVGCGYEIGDIIKSKDRSQLCNEIVDYVYNLFVDKISSFDFKCILKTAYTLLEQLIPETVIRNDNYKNQIHLYPDKEDDIRKMIFEYNASSVSLRFIIEYIGAMQNEGTNNCDIIDLEELMAYARTIVDWATASDVFNYEMVDDEIVVLGSKRFGYDKRNIDEINQYLSSEQFSYISKKQKTHSFSVKMEEKNELFRNDYGYSFEQYVSIIGLLCEYGESIEGELKSISYNKWVDLCEDRNVPGNLCSIIDDICIEKRLDYFIYEPFKTREFYPWRNNRLFSLLRKPIIKINNNYYWGNRVLNHNIFYISNLIDQGIFNSGKIGKGYYIKFNSDVAIKRGEVFNNLVYDLLSSFQEIEACKNVTNINSKHISDEYGNDLGDVDVLAISRKLKKVFIIEVKDYSMSRNINDLSLEIKKLFKGNGKEKSDYMKHMVRFKWIQEHKSDLVKAYKLNGEMWNLIPIFVTNQPMISRKFEENKSVNMIDYAKLNMNYLKKIK